MDAPTGSINSQSSHRTDNEIDNAATSVDQPIKTEEVTHSLQLYGQGRCQCGCIPQNICSLFEMAEKRKEFQRRKEKEASQAK